jgi:hypothetical protein
MIFLTENIPYTPKMLADELGFEENTVKLALGALENCNMVVTNQGHFTIAGWDEYQNIEGMDKIREQNRIRQKRWYDKQKLLPNAIPNASLTQPNATEEDIEKDIEKEEEKKSVRETSHTLFKRLLPDYIIPDNLAEKLTEWFKYKTERRESYKEQGMKSLLRQIENNQITYGEQAVCELIDESMANGWKGIIFDRLKNKPVANGGRKEKVPGWFQSKGATGQLGAEELAAIKRALEEENNAPEVQQEREQLEKELQAFGRSAL